MRESGRVPDAMPKRPRCPLNIGQLLWSSIVNFGFSGSVFFCSWPGLRRLMINTAINTQKTIMTAIGKTILTVFFIASMITCRPNICNRFEGLDLFYTDEQEIRWGFEFGARYRDVLPATTWIPLIRLYTGFLLQQSGLASDRPDFECPGRHL